MATTAIYPRRLNQSNEFCIPIACREDGMRCIELMQANMNGCPLIRIVSRVFNRGRLLRVDDGECHLRYSMRGVHEFDPSLHVDCYTMLTNDMLIINDSSEFGIDLLWSQSVIRWIDRVTNARSYVRPDDWDGMDPLTELPYLRPTQQQLIDRRPKFIDADKKKVDK